MDSLNDINSVESKSHITKLLESIQPIPSSHHFSNLDIDLSNSIGQLDNSYLGGLVIEPRECDELNFVISNYFEEIQRPLVVITSRFNNAFMENKYIQKMLKKNLLKIVLIENKSIAASDYNKLLLSNSLWKILPFKKVLIFQTDSLICKHSDYTIDDFLKFDYIGSAWTRERPIGLTIDGGSGGFSLRNIELSLSVIKNFDPNSWPGGEDGYYAFYLELIGGKVGKFDDCVKFSTQEVFLEKSFGCHKIELLDNESRKRFYNYEKNIIKIMNHGLNR